MNFKSLLFSAFAAGFAMSANAYEISIIEDGKLAAGMEVLEGEKVLEYSEGTAPDGASSAIFTPVSEYAECRIYNAEGFDLEKAWNVQVEYYYEEMDPATAEALYKQVVGTVIADKSMKLFINSIKDLNVVLNTNLSNYDSISLWGFN